MDMNKECHEFLKSLRWSNSRVKNGIPTEWISSWRDENKNNDISNEIISLVREIKSIKKYET